MKRVLFLFFALVSLGAWAGGGLKFEKAVENEILFLRDSKTFDEYSLAAAALKEISDKNTDRWEGFYWTAYAFLRKASVCESPVEKNQILADADYYIYRTELLQPENPELFVLKAWYYMELIRVSPFPNEQKFADIKDQWLKKAFEADGNNPRYYYIRAYEEFNAGPEDEAQREKARAYFQAAVQMYQQQPEPRFGREPLAPRWGKDDAELMAILLEGKIATDIEEAPGLFDEVGDPTEEVDCSTDEATEDTSVEKNSKKKKKGKKGKKDKKEGQKGWLF